MSDRLMDDSDLEIAEEAGYELGWNEAIEAAAEMFEREALTQVRDQRPAAECQIFTAVAGDIRKLKKP